jgi:hypothetical protein
MIMMNRDNIHPHMRNHRCIHNFIDDDVASLIPRSLVRG